MDTTRLDYASNTQLVPQSTRYTERNMVKNQNGHVLFSVPQLEADSFDFGPLSITTAQQSDPLPYPYPSPRDADLSSGQQRLPFPQSQGVDVTPYIFNPAYPTHPQSSQIPYHGHGAFPVNVNVDLSTRSVSLTRDPPMETPSADFSSPASNHNAVRRYHAAQSRLHALVLQQLTRSCDDRQQLPAQDSFGNVPPLESFELTPTGRRAEFYHAASSIPMCNIRHPSRPPEHVDHQLALSQQTEFLNQYQYPYYDHDVGYQENCRPESLAAHGLTTQGIGIYESAQQDPMSAFIASTKTTEVTNPSTSNPVGVALESNVYATHSSSHTIPSASIPLAKPFDEIAGPNEINSTSPSDLSSVSSAFTALTNGTTHDDKPSIVEKGSSMIEVESDNGDVEKSTGERMQLKERDKGTVTDNQLGTTTKRRDRKPSEGSGATARRKTSDPKSEPILKNGLPPPSKKRKKSKMHECQICYKNFPRPSGLKTHMNTHNNERPYPCPFPGCNRCFGVRSNAKRHLRTHGVVPPQNTGTQPYVVDFSTPMVLEQDGGLGPNEDSSLHGTADGDRSETQRGTRLGRGRGRQFKLRWMPPSSSTRSTAARGKAKKATIEPLLVESNDDDAMAPFSRSPSQRNASLGPWDEADLEGEDADALSDGEGDAEADLEDECQGDESDVEEIEEEFGASMAMQTGFLPSSDSAQQQASSSRTSLASSLSVSTTSTSAFSHVLSASSTSFTSVSSIPVQIA